MQFTTPELLAITGVSNSVFSQWLNRKHLVLSSGESPGKGNAWLHTPRDVLQVAVVAALTRLGVPLGRAKLVWFMAVAPAVDVPGGPAPTILLAPRPDGSDHDIRVVHGNDYGLDAPDAPTAFIALRVELVARRVGERMDLIKGSAS